ncbi:hypothetical protein [Rufibacter quisquiliarum]|uniref:Uncharacterized protein n=1 Tax=Rufibacter quisquiliarum TaxID=1549639 RepID=A0A839GWS9_9BACT|nr:hypothetical protein [Rufibacter quisquiliarum]MBA9078191.1 hypothetical protein [Rufibacter quisquiliarum]
MLEELIEKGKVSYMTKIGNISYCITLIMNEKIEIHYDYMVSINSLEPELERIIHNQLQTCKYRTIAICLMETIAYPPLPLIQLLNLVVSIEDTQDGQPVIYKDKIPILSYNQFTQILEHE